MGDIELELQKRGYILGPYIAKGATCDCFYVQNIKFPNACFICKVISWFTVQERAANSKFFKEEVDLLSKLDDPGIVRCYDYFTTEHNLYIVLEGCEKGSLWHLTVENLDYVQKNALYYGYQIASALVYCHQRRIAHLDIKPSNLFVNKYDKVKLGDFGTSVYLPENQEKISKRAGTRFYMAPEVLTGPYDPFKADIYSFGITLFLMLKKVGPTSTFDCQYFHKIVMEGCLELGEIGIIIQQCIQLNPDDRPDAMTLYNELSALYKKQLIKGMGSSIKQNYGSPKRLRALTDHLKLSRRCISKTKSTKVIKPITIQTSGRIGSIGYI